MGIVDCACTATFTSRSPTLSREVRDGLKEADGDGDGDASSAPVDPRLDLASVLLLAFLPLGKGDNFPMSSFSCRCRCLPIALSSRSARATNRKEGGVTRQAPTVGEAWRKASQQCNAIRDHTNGTVRAKWTNGQNKKATGVLRKLSFCEAWRFLALSGS